MAPTFLVIIFFSFTPPSFEWSWEKKKKQMRGSVHFSFLSLWVFQSVSILFSHSFHLSWSASNKKCTLLSFSFPHHRMDLSLHSAPYRFIPCWFPPRPKASLISTMLFWFGVGAPYVSFTWSTFPNPRLWFRWKRLYGSDASVLNNVGGILSLSLSGI